MRSRSTISKPVIAGFLAFVISLAADTPLDNQYLRDHALTRGFTLGRPVAATPTPDGKSVLFLRAQPRQARLELYEFDVATRQTRLLLTPGQVLKGASENLSPEEKARRERMRVSVGGLVSYQLSKDGKRVLLPLSGKLYLLERGSGAIRELKTAPGTILDPKFSPDGQSVAFARDYDVHVYDLPRDQEHGATTGGSELASHGLAEFVAQEEMDRFSGYWWSPDARYIAYEEADAHGVEVWHVADPAKPGQPPLPSFYPRPGKANVKARLGVVSTSGGATTWVKWDAERYPYLTQVDWSEGGGLTLCVMTRDQQELVLFRADPKTGQTTPLLTEKDPAWINLNSQMPHWLKNGTFLWTSERDGGPQLELREHSGALRTMLVPPAIGYHSLAAVDEATGVVYFHASANPTRSHLFRAPLQGGAAVALTDGPGVQSANFGKQESIYTLNQTDSGKMPTTTVRRVDGTVLGELPSVAENPPFVPKVELLKVGEGEGFYARVIRPRNFDPARRYPVVLDVYGGPHSLHVADTMSSHLLGQWI
ncbi:MAG TPA: DPP IV N-terminal domain-containing protein, partial [Verrucomicrobiae bacterium]|nr:DPP IV N-terminal domain-containing protein [Verrucomicrobiae bacterium]